MTFTGHDKRVTLNLGRLSACVAKNTDLRKALDLLPDVDFDLAELPRDAIEMIYAEFDTALEQQIISEWTVDPGYLIDLVHPTGMCPLCGHEHIRFLFKVVNTKNETELETGSSCIITHGMHVKGADTAEHARKILEKAVRTHLRKLEIEDWHKRFDFQEGFLGMVYHALIRIRQDARVGSSGAVGIAPGAVERRQIHQMASRHIRDLKKLTNFYGRSGWLGTTAKWAEWGKIASFARALNDVFADAVPAPCAWQPKPPAPVLSGVAGTRTSLKGAA